MRYRELKRMYDLMGPQKTVHYLRDCLEQKLIEPAEFSLRTLAEALIPEGREFVEHCRPLRKASVNLLESGAVDVSAFSHITAQLMYAKVMEGYQQEEFVASRLVETIPTRQDGEKIPGVTPIGDGAEIVDPGQPYPLVGFSEDYIETPGTDKRGMVCAVTREAIFFDRTSLVLRNAFKVGEMLALNKEKRVLDVIVGVTNNYKWNGTSYDTYQDSAPWVNVQSGNDLVDWTDIDASEQLFADLVDPHTGEPILVQPRMILVMPARLHTARRILAATEVRSGDGASGSMQTITANPLAGYELYSSRLAYRRVLAAGVVEANAKAWWFHGDFRRAFGYMENWPITVSQAPPNHHDEFERDIVIKVKASERGAAVVLDPRYVVKNYAA